MYPQALMGTREESVSPRPSLPGLYLAEVVATVPQDHAVMVVLAALSTIEGNQSGTEPQGIKAHVLEQRAGPYLGGLDLPSVGTMGLVGFVHGSDKSCVWLGALNQDLANLAWSGKGQADRLDHHDSGVYALLDAAGNLDWVHPSGTRVRVGTGTAAAARQRQEAQGETRRTVAYAIPTKAAVSVHVEHSSGTLLTIDPSGDLTVTGVGTKAETITGAVTEHDESTKAETVDGNLTEQYNGTKAETVVGNVTEDYQAAWTLQVGLHGQVTVTGNLVIQAADVTIEGAPGNHTHLGGTALEDFLAKLAALTLIASTFNAHTHPDPQGGNTSAPSQTLAFTAGTHYSQNMKGS